jgi:hypothetical protein
LLAKNEVLKTAVSGWYGISKMIAGYRYPSSVGPKPFVTADPESARAEITAPLSIAGTLGFGLVNCCEKSRERMR